MRLTRLLPALSLAIACLPAFSQGTVGCEAVLAPTIESATSDYRLLQAYMSLNAAEEYDRLRRMSADKREAEASYKVFSAEYKDAQTSSEFKEKVSKRLKDEQFSSSESDARAVYRKGPTDAQVRAWSECQRGGGLLVTVRDQTADEFTLLITWMPPVGAPAQNAEILLSGATIDDRASLQTSFAGRGSVGRIAKISRGASSARIVVNIGGFTDTALLARQPQLRLVQRTKTCSETDPCREGLLRVLQCLPSLERPTEFQHPGQWMSAPDGPPSPARTAQIEFGPWSNTQCDLSGNGWHARVGSCGKGGGTGWNRCTSVRVEALVPEKVERN